MRSVLVRVVCLAAILAALPGCAVAFNVAIGNTAASNLCQPAAGDTDGR